MMWKQAIKPRGYHPMVDLLTDAELKEFVGGIKNVLDRCVEVMPTHAEFIAKNCAAPDAMMAKPPARQIA